MFSCVLVANRCESAVRVIGALHELGVDLHAPDDGMVVHEQDPDP